MRHIKDKRLFETEFERELPVLAGRSNCCDAPVYGESDICTKCKEHCEVIPAAGANEGRRLPMSDADVTPAYETYECTKDMLKLLKLAQTRLSDNEKRVAERFGKIDRSGNGVVFEGDILMKCILGAYEYFVYVDAENIQSGPNKATCYVFDLDDKQDIQDVLEFIKHIIYSEPM